MFFQNSVSQLGSGTITLLVVVVVISLGLTLIAASLKIVPQAQAYVVEKLGAYHKTLHSGIHWVWPVFFRVAQKISLKEQVKDFDPQAVITMDNVTMQIDTVVYYQITDPKLYCYGVDRPKAAIENLTATTLRNIVGELELDETLTSREIVNTKMRSILDEATDPWGIKINRVELKNILPPKDIREAMEKQMRAERERREAILKAEGEKKSNILVAEGEKEAAILRADAKRIALMSEAEGTAEAIKKIIEAKPDAAYLTLQGFEALKSLASSESTKIVIPSELQNVTSLLTSMKEIVGDKETSKKSK